FLRTYFVIPDTPTTEIYTLSLHDALPIWRRRLDERPVELGLQQHPREHGAPVGRGRGRDRIHARVDDGHPGQRKRNVCPMRRRLDRKSTRLNSSHSQISYAVFCLKKKKNK